MTEEEHIELQRISQYLYKVQLYSPDELNKMRFEELQDHFEDVTSDIDNLKEYLVTLSDRIQIAHENEGL